MTVFKAEYYGDDPGEEITPANAAVMIAKELRFIRRTLFAMTFDQNCETALHQGLASIEAGLLDGPIPESLAEIAKRRP